MPFWRRKRSESELPAQTDIDVVTVGIAVENNFGCYPQEKATCNTCRDAAAIAVGTLRQSGYLDADPSPMLGLSADVWMYDVSDGDPRVAVITEAILKSRNDWRTDDELGNFGRVAIASLARQHRLDVPVAV